MDKDGLCNMWQSETGLFSHVMGKYSNSPNASVRITIFLPQFYTGNVLWIFLILGRVSLVINTREVSIKKKKKFPNVIVLK